MVISTRSRDHAEEEQIMKTYDIVLNETRNVSLRCFILDCECTYIPATERPAVIILPGGAYQFHSDREAEPVARAFLNAGFHSFILYYSVGKHAVWPNPLSDYEQAVDLLLSRSDEWHICQDKIAVTGFSAGGHLAACAATMASIRPAAAILGYPVIKDYIGEICTPGLPHPSDHVDGRTSPCFLFACRDDKAVDVSNFLDFQLALTKAGIEFESHIYGLGGHGFSTGAEEFQEQPLCGRVKNWPSDAVAWLNELWGKMVPSGFTDPLLPRYITSDNSGRLSLDCTMAFLRRKEAAREPLKKLFPLLDAYLARLDLPDASKEEFQSYYTMRFLATVSGMSANDILELEKTLNAIPSEA